MDLIIRGRAQYSSSPSYRGTYRSTPHYVDNAGPEHEVNQLFRWYCDEGGDLGVVHELEKARKLVAAYSRLDPPQHLEIIEVTTDSREPEVGGEFLGYDLSAGFNYSLLSWGLEIDREPPAELSRKDAPWVLQPLLRLTKRYFQPQLNTNGLFEDYNTAQFCLDCMMALQKLRPGLWENEQVVFEIVGVWKVDV